MSVYTKNGDSGNTRINGNCIYSKADIICDVVGTLDELNSSLGFLNLSNLNEIKEEGVSIQNDLFLLGTYITQNKNTLEDIYFWDRKVKDMEKKIDLFDSKNEPLSNFILPGGCEESCYLHKSRSICRRLERTVLRYITVKKLNLNYVIVYLNRLSDYLFVLARYSNTLKNIQDIIWRKS